MDVVLVVVAAAVTVLPAGETTYHLAPKASTAWPLSWPADVSPLKKYSGWPSIATCRLPSLRLTRVEPGGRHAAGRRRLGRGGEGRPGRRAAPRARALRPGVLREQVERAPAAVDDDGAQRGLGRACTAVAPPRSSRPSTSAGREPPEPDEPPRRSRRGRGRVMATAAAELRWVRVMSGLRGRVVIALPPVRRRARGSFLCAPSPRRRRRPGGRAPGAESSPGGATSPRSMSIASAAWRRGCPRPARRSPPPRRSRRRPSRAARARSRPRSAPRPAAPRRRPSSPSKSPLTSAGPNDRAGFIEVPLTGADHRPASAM